MVYFLRLSGHDALTLWRNAILTLNVAVAVTEENSDKTWLLELAKIAVQNPEFQRLLE